MTTAANIVALALRTSGVLGVGQTAQTQDTQDAFALLNDQIDQWNAARVVAVIPGVLPNFSDLTTDVPGWTHNENVLVWNLSVRLRAAFGMPEDEQQTKIAILATQILQANNMQQQAPQHTGSTTAISVIFLALRMAKRVTDAQGVTDGSQDVSDALALLNNMLAQWSKERWLVYDLKDLAKLSTGATSYSIGPGADIDCPRPDRLESAFIRIGRTGTRSLVNGDFALADFASADFYTGGAAVRAIDPVSAIDYPLQILQSREDYNRIAFKGLVGFPLAVFLDSDYPFGTVQLYPTPVADQFEIHLSIKATLPEYVTLATDLGVPPEYREAIVTNLACRIVALNGEQPSGFLLGLARASLKTIRAANVQIPRLVMPGCLPGMGYGNNGGYGGALVSRGDSTLTDENGTYLIAG